MKNDKKLPIKNQNLPIIVIVLAIIAIYYFTNNNTGFSNIRGNIRVEHTSYSQLKQYIRGGNINKVTISETTIRALDDGNKVMYVARLINDPQLIPTLDAKNIQYSAISDSNWLTKTFSFIFPFIIIILIWLFITSRFQKKMGGGILGMNSSKKLINSEKPDVRFDSVAGNDEAKEEVVEIVDFLKYPQRYISLGAKIPKGVLLVGAPGVGKTLLARAVAGEASVPFFSVTGSSFIEMFVGVGASRVRDLFDQAKKSAPAIIFIDEIDAIGKSRSSSHNMGGNDEREQTLNQLLAEMDGFNSTIPVIVLAATNRPEVLDSALLRPGRFDRQVLVDKPDYQGRLDILNVHIKNVKLAKDVDLKEVAKLTAGLAGADLANVVNEAALLAGRINKKEVEQSDFKESVERTIAGMEKKSKRIEPKEKNIVAYHESGHALISEITKGAKKVSKVSIIPRGLAALGYTLNTPEENKYLVQKHELMAEVDVLLGGRAAEEVFLKEISTGASNDLERATSILESMIQTYGMTDISGLMVVQKVQGSFLSGAQKSSRDCSEDLSKNIDKFIKTTLDERYKEVKESLKIYGEAIEAMAKELLDEEVISGARVVEIIETFEKENDMETRVTPTVEYHAEAKLAKKEKDEREKIDESI